MGLPFLLLLLLSPVLIGAFLIFDRLVRLEYREYNGEWENDGKPIGFFWKPPGAMEDMLAIARTKLCFQWLFKSPHWMLQNPQAMSLVKWLRICVAIWNIGGLAIAALLFLRL